ncbi:P-type ATPase (P-ATPase) Superfamily Protein [Monocercomonoides exilis]|uniref:P-type ATPase (P-ATPase) Superfamily Protein n=1 Tax=Monocercomonoides exilis TaxID=2049356 RepID=UPI00355A7F3C|nr:P-type ATPase (P-ATPase) Superfamily Protein [Monocercomonoides exilis]|eukprot:MONOS_8492.1-p1 / transcript=MONOS_8492.1 / gene=MONOS_8492 / organism=Monocercomonoides_exilis_PA203 / gene_product=P-type ATPase (P-ATPase) Superfamily Protein / transcript_product=P-type ATPase (P-ATPase) Superfamily Protein / location=Mono_scaffold00321:29857-33416(+) / protein_length=1158 / sequence_SO=supercontig / SO=protein_coding / is_pseudo=false
MSGTWIEKEKLLHIMDEKGMGAIEECGGLENIMKQLHTSPNGLSQDKADFNIREEKYGKNQFPQPKSKPWIKMWLEAFNDKTLIILMVLAVISLVVSVFFESEDEMGWIDGVAILMTVVVVTLVSSINTWSQEKQFQKLNERQKDRTLLVIRDGETIKTSIFDLQVGDIFVVQTGEILPADGLCIESSDIQCNEAPMTGESDLIKKDPTNCPFLLCGCKVQNGMGKMVVVAVGLDTQFGKIKRTILENAQAREDTPLQKKLSELSDKIGNIGIYAAIVTLILLISFWGIALYKDRDLWDHGKYLKVLVEYFIVAVTIVVVAVPEGLPLAVTISLAYSMKKMLTDNNLVRRLESCETMGGATTICSDKTGTLTENRMTVAQGFFNGEHFTKVNDLGGGSAASKSSGNSASSSSKGGLPHKYLDLLCEAISMNSSANLKGEGNNVQYLGNVTECAMLLFARQLGFDYDQIRADNTTVQAFPFSSEKKRMTVITDKKDNYRVFTKGASEIVSALCTKMIVVGENGKPTEVPVDSKLREKINTTIQKMASSGLRTIAISYKDVPKSQVKPEGPNGELYPDNAPPEFGLTLIGITGIKDPLRAEVVQAIERCHDAHVVVRMVTGDNIETAKHIAEEAGIFDPKNGIAIEGPVFRALSPEDRQRLIPRLQVMARSSPIDKHTLVSALQEMGHVVAVTGDGTNDAPALSKSDVGFAMGITGTEVAKDASAIIITDDNFASIVKAAMWGRNVYDSIRKFIQFQLTVNLVAIAINVIGAVFAITPLKAVQMLWVNLIMDTLAALALATESPTEKLLKRKPYGKSDEIICASMWRNIITGVIYQLAALLVCLFAWGAVDPTVPCPLKEGDVIECSHLLFPHGVCREFLLDPSVRVFSKEHFSFVFNMFIWMQVFNEIASRRCYNELNFFDRIFESSNFMLIMIATAVLQYAIMTIEPLPFIFGIIPISARLWKLSIAIGFGILPVQFLVRLLFRTEEPFHGEIEIKPDPGVPAGTYTLNGGAPKGCQIKVPAPPKPATASASASTESKADEESAKAALSGMDAPAPPMNEYVPMGFVPGKLTMQEVAQLAIAKQKGVRGPMFKSSSAPVEEKFMSSAYSVSARKSAFMMKSGKLNKFKMAAAMGADRMKKTMQNEKSKSQSSKEKEQ